MRQLAFISSLWLVISNGTAQAQLTPGETRTLQIAALREFRATTDTTRNILCVGLLDSTGVNGILAQQRLSRRPVDADSYFLSEVGSVARVRPLSDCKIPERADAVRAVTSQGPQRAWEVWVTPPELNANEAIILVWGRAELWRCAFAKDQAGWGKPDCKMIFEG